MITSKTAIITQGDCLHALMLTIQDFEDFAPFAEYKAIIQERCRDRLGNRNNYVSYWLIEGEDLQDALHNFNTTPEHDMLIDINDPEFSILFEQVV
ncbi:hypothetical protein VP249E411_P0146 [Vibrio phage 249E41-1]|nr:hypothetical protein VP249E411_P0146 [Vibrio phage 249E41-1]